MRSNVPNQKIHEPALKSRYEMFVNFTQCAGEVKTEGTELLQRLASDYEQLTNSNGIISFCLNLSLNLILSLAFNNR